MDASRVVYAASLVFHVGIGAVLTVIEPPPKEEIIAIEMTTIDTPEDEEEKPEPEPEPEPEQPAAPQPKAAAPAEAPAAAPPDFGFVLGPSTGGPGGIAVAVAPSPAPVRQEARTLSGPSTKAACGEPEKKAKPLAAVGKPAYTEEARAAAIEGKIRIELSIDVSGRVTDAVVLKGLGLGLDEAAVSAAKSARFTPATRCGEPVASKFVVAFTFTL